MQGRSRSARTMPSPTDRSVADQVELGLAAAREVHPVRIKDPHRPVPDLKLHVPSHKEKLAATGHTRTCCLPAPRRRRMGSPDAGDGGLRSPSRRAYRSGTACARRPLEAGPRPRQSRRDPHPGQRGHCHRQRKAGSHRSRCPLHPAMAVDGRCPGAWPEPPSQNPHSWWGTCSRAERRSWSRDYLKVVVNLRNTNSTFLMEPVEIIARPLPLAYSFVVVRGRFPGGSRTRSRADTTTL